MVVIFALIFGLIVAGSLNEVPNQNKDTTTQVKVNKDAENKPVILEVEANPKIIEPIKEVVKSEPIKEEVKSDPIKEVVKSEVKKTDLIKEEINDIENLDEKRTGWLKLVLYILGPIFTIIFGKYFYNKLRKNSQPSRSTDYLRRDFKEDTQSDTTEQQSVQEDTQPDTTEQQSVQEDTQPDTTEQQETEEDENNKK